MQDGRYVVVEFPEEEEALAIIHKNWIDGDSCMWPRHAKQIRSLLKVGAMPGSNWKRVPFDVISAHDNYDDALRGLRKAEDSCASESGAERGRGKRKKKSKNYNDEGEMPLPQPPQTMLKRAAHSTGNRQTRTEPARASAYLQHSTYSEPMLGAFANSGEIADRNAYDENHIPDVRSAPRERGTHGIANSLPSSYIGGSTEKTCTNMENFERLPQTPSSGQHANRPYSQLQQWDQSELERCSYRANTHAYSPLRSASVLGNDNSGHIATPREPAYCPSRASVSAADRLSTPSSRHTIGSIPRRLEPSDAPVSQLWWK